MQVSYKSTYQYKNGEIHYLGDGVFEIYPLESEFPISYKVKKQESWKVFDNALLKEGFQVNDELQSTLDELMAREKKYVQQLN